jgi:hypothetical protein
MLRVAAGRKTKFLSPSSVYFNEVDPLAVYQQYVASEVTCDERHRCKWDGMGSVRWCGVRLMHIGVWQRFAPPPESSLSLSRPSTALPIPTPSRSPGHQHFSWKDGCPEATRIVDCLLVLFFGSGVGLCRLTYCSGGFVFVYASLNLPVSSRYLLDGIVVFGFESMSSSFGSSVLKCFMSAHLSCVYPGQA